MNEYVSIKRKSCQNPRVVQVHHLVPHSLPGLVVLPIMQSVMNFMFV